MKRLLSIFLVFLSLQVTAQNYNVGLIPDSLLKNAHVVKRMEEVHVIIKSLNNVVVTNKYALTILDEEGDEASSYLNAYSIYVRFQELKKVRLN